MKNSWVLLPFLMVYSLSGCKAYKRDLMLQFDKRFDAGAVEQSVDRAAGNYIIQPNDYVRLDVFTNDGERLIDPNFELSIAGGANQQTAQQRERFSYLVMEDGTARLPKVGTISLQGLTINEAEEMLQEAYNAFYKESFVKLRPANRRAVVLGAAGAGASGGLVVPLENENMTILEVLALAGGVQQGGKVSSIRLIRGDLNNPKVFDIDLSTIAGMKQSAMIVESEDVIYIEPWRRPFRDTLRDTAPVLSLFTSVLTLIFILQK